MKQLAMGWRVISIEKGHLFFLVVLVNKWLQRVSLSWMMAPLRNVGGL